MLFRFGWWWGVQGWWEEGCGGGGGASCKSHFSLTCRAGGRAQIDPKQKARFHK